MVSVVTELTYQGKRQTATRTWVREEKLPSNDPSFRVRRLW
ncbi:hypothetical protein ACFP81_05555 [Deinococcus lacus]|uniref:Uncharacterized protein n=1 Tax=Deinococcus lacus TaxID=392561 RepID=A0ABW1YBY4_9DEIO